MLSVGHSSVVQCPLMMPYVIGSIHLGGPIKLFFVPASAIQLVYQWPWYVVQSYINWSEMQLFGRAFEHGAMDHGIDPSRWTQ